MKTSITWFFILLILASAMVFSMHPEVITLADYTVSDYVELMTPFLLVALFIERALEVFLTVWRGPKSAEMEHDLKFQKGKKGGADAGKTEERKLLAYKQGTQARAFGVAVVVGIIISALGLRALEMLFDADVFASLPELQRGMIQVLDILITGALLGGGADGVHKVLALFTTYMDETKRKVKEK